MERPGKDINETMSMEMQCESDLENLIPCSSYQWCNPECVVESGEIAPHILDLARTRKADLIVLGARPEQSWFTHLQEGTTGQVLLEAECPVLTIRGQ